MKSRIFLVLMSITTFSFGALVEQWEFGPSNNYSSITLNDYDLDGDTNTVILTKRHIGGDSLTSGASTGWDARETQGATLGTPAAGSSRLGSTQEAILNGYYGPTSFKGVPWVGPTDTPPAGYLTNGYYVAYAANQDIVTVTLKVTDIDFDQTTGNSQNNANFSFRLWDKATGIVGGVANTYFIGLQVMDTYAADRLQLALVTSNGTLLSGGSGLTGNNNRTRIGWLTANNTLADSTDYEFVLTLDLAFGMWDGSINGVD